MLPDVNINSSTSKGVVVTVTVVDVSKVDVFKTVTNLGCRCLFGGFGLAIWKKSKQMNEIQCCQLVKFLNFLFMAAQTCRWIGGIFFANSEIGRVGNTD